MIDDENIFPEEILHGVVKFYPTSHASFRLILMCLAMSNAEFQRMIEGGGKCDY